MAKKFLVDLDLSQNELQNATIQNLATDPSGGVKGQIYYNTGINKYKYYDGNAWTILGEGNGTVTSVAVANATNGGLSVSGSPITGAGTINIGHSNVLTNAQTTSGLYPIKIDKNGHITEYGTAVDLSTYAPKSSPTFTGTPKAPTAAAGTNTTQIATTAFVTTAVSALAGGMTYKGTIGTGGTAGTALPTSGVKVGDTYKIITAGTYAGQAAKVGDVFIATATTPTWSYIPSGDDDAVTQVTAGAGLNTTSDDTSTDGGNITTTGTLYLTKTAVTPGTYQGLVVDKYGRITGATDEGYQDASDVASAISTALANYVTLNTSQNITANKFFDGSTLSFGTTRAVGNGSVSIDYSGITVAGTGSSAAQYRYSMHITKDTIEVSNGDNSVSYEMEKTLNKVTSISSSSTDTQYPTAKAVYDFVGTSTHKYSTTITGNASTASFTVTHNLGTRDVIVQVYDNSTYEEVLVDVVRTNTSTVTVTFGTAPASSKSYRVVCIG